ncbi:hypothetical protein OJ252_2576 [Cryptosporidium canis]|uniref:Uncharacterized protein n=1 Tax=Cryptosporidium canis TaxID=195482 RepID=A0ABQ8P4T6_9CRYT|nr:hypothetical protein OJ252_2576 [Cryptosporidium canis]
MSSVVETQTIINGRLVELRSGLETGKISERLEDLSGRVNDLLTSYIGKESDCLSQDSNDEYQDQCSDQTDDDMHPIESPYEEDCKSTGCGQTGETDPSGTANGKRHKVDTSDRQHSN